MLHKNKWMLMLSAIMAILIMTGCTGDDSGAGEEIVQETPAPDAEEESTQPEEEDQTSDTTLAKDEDLTQQIEAEKGIEGVMVQVVGGDQKAVNVDIEINDEQELSVDEVIEKYGEMIKEEYPDHTIDIIVVKDGTIQKQTQL